MKVRIYNKDLNPSFWTKDKTLKEPIKNGLLKIAYNFLKDVKAKFHVRDIYFLGSSANYNWTPTSDVDLHILIDFNDLSMPKKEAKKYTKMLTKNWNEKRNILIKNHKIEIYIQDVSEVNKSTGVYSLIANRWIKEALPQKIVLNRNLIQNKYTTWANKINSAIKEQDVDKLNFILKGLVNMRQIGLSTVGEFSTENLVFKILRQSGLIKKLKNSINLLKNKELSLNEEVVSIKSNDELSKEDFEKLNSIIKNSGINILSNKELNSTYYVDDELVGALFTSHNNDNFDFDIVVDSNSQEYAIGLRMIKSAIAEYKQLKMDIPELTMTVNVVNSKLVRILSMLNFKIVRKVGNHVYMKYSN